MYERKQEEERDIERRGDVRRGIQRSNTCLGRQHQESRGIQESGESEIVSTSVPGGCGILYKGY